MNETEETNLNKWFDAKVIATATLVGMIVTGLNYFVAPTRQNALDIVLLRNDMEYVKEKVRMQDEINKDQATINADINKKLERILTILERK